jgi:hypothetical protein
MIDMAKALTVEFSESEAIELENILSKIQSANEAMKRDQVVIDKLKMEPRAIAKQTRSVLDQLEASA